MIWMYQMIGFKTQYLGKQTTEKKFSCHYIKLHHGHIYIRMFYHGFEIKFINKRKR